MIYRFVCVIIVMNILYELIEVLMPAKRLKTMVKSFVLIVMFCVVCEYISLMI